MTMIMSIHRRIRRGMPTTILLLLSLPVLRIDAALQQHSPTSSSSLSSSSRNYQVAQEILEGLQQKQQQIQPSSSSAKQQQQQQQQLDLETDFYDVSTGLYSEGVWHNCMAGIATLQLNRRRRSRSSRHLHTTTTATTTRHTPSSQERYDNDHANAEDADDDTDDAITRISDSLFQNSWDGVSFRRRTWSGNWDHSRLKPKDTDVVQSNYYKESTEHRCIQHGIALVFWSMLANNNYNNNNNNNVNDSKNTIIRSQQSLIAKQFLNEYWNGRRWTTIGRSQGSGTTFRPSASSGINTRKDRTTATMTDTDTEDDDAPLYFRAVDQAIAIVACLHHIDLLDNTTEEGGHGEEEEERERFDTIIRMTCRDLLDEEDGFGYNNLSTSRTYLGIHRNRNFWHEGWVMLALTMARDYVWPMDVQEGHLRILWDGLMERYTTKQITRGNGAVEDDVDDATIWHYRLSEKDVPSNVRYCGDNALAFAIRRNLRCRHQSTIAGEFVTKEDGGNTDDNDDADDADDVAFWKFIDMLRSGNEEGNSDGDNGGDAYHHLASVADVYPQVRLHPNTELAALLVWPP